MILEAQHIEKNFGDYRALDDVSIAVREGSIFGLLGPNGAGKTTLIRLINRISRPDKGVILLGGQPMTDGDVQHIGYLPEERGLYKKMKVGEQAVYLAQLKGLSRREAERRLIQWFDKFGISGAASADIRRAFQRLRPRQCHAAQERDSGPSRQRRNGNILNPQYGLGGGVVRRYCID